jgi:hypothetical protein
MRKRSGLLALVLVLVPVTGASAWTGNTFQSPSGNLVCKYRNWTDSIACGAYSSQKIISMTATGRPVEGARMTFGDSTWHTLAYGQSWNRGGSVSCHSLSAGMRCQNTQGWFFLVNSTRLYVGRYGQYLYWL